MEAASNRIAVVAPLAALVLSACLAASASFALAADTESVAPPERPNVLFVVIDDLNMHLGSYGHPQVRTPHIDRLAGRGVRFDRAYAQYPLCNPSRESLLSGRRPESTRVWDNTATSDQGRQLPEHFRRHGYFTARLGKIAHSARHERAAQWDLSEDAPPRSNTAPRLPPGKDAEPWFIRQLLLSGPTDGDDADEPDGATARRAVELMHEPRQQPFFLAVGFHKPHLPFIAPRRYFDLYPADQVALAVVPKGARDNVPAVALQNSTLDRALTDAEARHAVAAYWACVTFVDAQVGLLLDALDRLNLAERTIVVLFSDHGFHLGDHGLWQKGTLFEEATRVPLIVAAPGRQRAAVSPRLVELVDLYPTLAELCGLPRPEGSEGRSLVPLLDDPQQPWSDTAFTLTWPRGVSDHPGNGPEVVGRSLRTARYRFNLWQPAGDAELYDHETDPGEHQNLAGDPAHAKLQSDLHAQLSPAPGNVP